MFKALLQLVTVHPGLLLCMIVTWPKNIVDIFWLLSLHSPFMTPLYVTDSPMLFQMYLLNTLWSFYPLDCGSLFCRYVINSSKIKRSTNVNSILFLPSPEILQSASLTHHGMFNSRSCRSLNILLNGYNLYTSPSSPPIISKKIRFWFLKVIVYIIQMTLKTREK